jgi:hypothetical protein
MVITTRSAAQVTSIDVGGWIMDGLSKGNDLWWTKTKLLAL